MNLRGLGSNRSLDAGRRTSRHLEQRLGRDRPQHHSADRHRQHRGDHRRRLVGVRRRRAGGRDEHQDPQQLRRHGSARPRRRERSRRRRQGMEFSTLIGTNLAGKGHAMVGIDYSKREISLWKNRELVQGRDGVAALQLGRLPVRRLSGVRNRASSAPAATRAGGGLRTRHALHDDQQGPERRRRHQQRVQQHWAGNSPSRPP